METKYVFFVSFAVLAEIVLQASGQCPCPTPAPSCPQPCPSAPIQFLPVPQPIPIQIPQQCAPPQTVTIPNIIMALLPPTTSCNTTAPAPLPCPAPAPLVIPIPQPKPYYVPCGCSR